MTDWPPIAEPELRRRLGMADEEFVAWMIEIIGSVGPRPFDDSAYTQALGYPWWRPPTSYWLDGESVEPLGDAPGGAGEGRHALLAFGSNGAPEALIRKFAHLPAEERRIAVVAGDLHDFDVVAAAHPTAYGSFPATLHPSPGTVLRAAVLWATPVQLTALAWTEVSYLLGRLSGIRFDPDLPEAAPVRSVLAFVSRWGAHGVVGSAAALEALPARGRSARAYTQEQLLGRLAAEAIGAEATARDLVAWIYADFAAASRAIRPIVQPAARPFASEQWERMRDAGR
jgi:hypothetical protein